MKKSNKKSTLISTVLIIVLLALIVILDNVKGVPALLLTVLRKGAVYSLVAVSMNLLNGFTGLFSLGQAGFMLLGAYTYAILTIPVDKHEAVYQYFDGGCVNFCINFIPALILAGIVAAIFAYLIGLPVLRLKSDYLAIATLGFAEIIRSLIQFEKLGPVTNASNLLYEFPSFKDFTLTVFGKTLSLTTFMPFLIAGICIAIICLLINSTYGRAFKAIRDDEIAAEAMGINLAKHKMLSFVTSAFFAGISGAMLAMYQASVQATVFKAAMTYEILLIVVIGGIGSITGSCLGSFLFIACSEWWLRFLDNELYIGSFQVPLLRSGFRMVVFSVVIMLIVLFKREGIMGDREFSIEGIKRLFSKFKKKSSSVKEGDTNE